MKWMIASDLHGDAVCTAALLQQFKASGAERLVLLGDLLYHGPRNDLPSGYAPKQVIALLNDVRDSLVCVRGNCDTEVDQMVLNFPILSETACLFAGGRTYIAAHGHHDVPPMRAGDVLLGGHTHVPVFERRTADDGTVYLHINPGSVSLPKENSPHSYVIIDGDRVIFYTLEGDVYREEKIK
ncbi:MAG: phosphodiesterase [Ruminococcaceae bacterium]|nr:phosphodiesterase [Oscillospiraceae bacterium]